MSLANRLVDSITERSGRVIVLVLVVTLLLGAGAGNIEESAEMDMFAEEPQEVETERYVQDAFGTHDENTTQLVVMVRNESGNVLSRESLLASLRYQQRLRDNSTVNSTLVGERATFGIENLVATAALEREQRSPAGTGGDGAPTEGVPSLAQQREQLASMTDDEVEAVVTGLLDTDAGAATADASTERRLALDLLPESYEPGSATADGRLTVVTFETDGLVVSIPELSEAVRDGQVTADALAEEVSRDEYALSGLGLMLVEEQESISDSLSLVGPLALLFVLGTLSVAYRDTLDILLGLVGILLVLVWTFGAMGWLGIDFSLVMMATPILLIGLSIDYAIHVVMRYRESRTSGGVTDGGSGPSPRKAIRQAISETLSGLGPALVLVTATAVLGFLSIRTGGVPALGDFGLATAAGIVAALVIFGAFLPACKVVLEERLERRGHDRAHRAVGTTGWLRAGLSRLSGVSYRRPVAIVFVVLVVSSMGALGATQLGTNFSTDDYIAEDPPAWTEELPEPLAPGEYEIRETQQQLYASFQSPDQQVHIVSEGGVASPETLERIAAAESAAAERSVVVDRPTGEPAVVGPIGTMWAVAETNETFRTLLSSADTTGDGVPDRNVTAVLDGFREAAPEQADRLLDPTGDGEYASLQILVTVDGAADPSVVAEEMRDVGHVADGEANTVTVAGDAIVNELVQRQLATTTLEGLIVALVTVLLVLLVAFRYKRSSASLGAVTLLPVLFALSWILGAMALVGLPFSFATALIGSIAIGLGVDYAIHVSERFGYELDRREDVETALEESVVGTGGALLGSAVTTAGGFGVLAFALVPIMQQFGLLIALTLVAAFVASVGVLPSLLVLWSRWQRPSVACSRSEL